MLKIRKPDPSQPPKQKPPEIKEEVKLTLRRNDINLSQRNKLRIEAGVSEEENFKLEPDQNSDQDSATRRRVLSSVVGIGPKTTPSKPEIQDKSNEKNGCSIS
jgi:hypothetical protein